MIINPVAAKDQVPLLASMADNLPTAWASYYFDMQFLTMMTPVGLYFCFKKLTDDNIFLILYAFTGYAPDVCILCLTQLFSTRGSCVWPWTSLAQS